MTRSWFGRLISVLGLLLIAQLVHAGPGCVSPLGEQSATPQTVAEDGCDRTGSAAACIEGPQRLGAAMTTAASPLPHMPPAADAPRHAQAVAAAAAAPRLSAGPAPGPSAPLFILFRRYLS